jgi:SEC-C motif
MTKPGRNDPCYCGSGKKYKQCHLRSDAEAEREQRERIEAARFLRRDLPRFARDERLRADFDEGLSFYWNGYYDAENAGQMSEFEALRYLDWLVFDHKLESGERIIDLYDEELGETLTPQQLALLAQWREAGAASAYELTSYDGQELELRDVFSGETSAVFEASGRGNVEIGEIILVRLVPVFDRVEFSTVAAYLPGGESEGLVAYMEAARDDAEGSLSLAEFAAQNSHLPIHYALQQAEEAGRPPVARLDKNRPTAPIQPEGHEFESDKERVIRPRTYGRTRQHTAQTRRKAV